MRMISLALVAAALLQLPASFAATLDSSDECAAHSQSDMRTCLEKKIGSKRTCTGPGGTGRFVRDGALG